ncbi:MAG: hypothetical protein ABI171_16225 [Collimonas sp.]|uniref:hypothetical protein n=1 Tax=Collimonas sp. TaxID=1963772 RepID=UPI0032638E20
MANKFDIVISATDRVTATVAKINASVARMTAPITRINKSVAGFSKEMGFDKVGRGIGGVAKSAGELAGKLSAIAAPMALLIGGGTIAGIAALATEWGRLGSEITRVAASIGMPAAALMSLQGAAQAVGVSSQELSGGLKSLGDTMEDALYGRNQAALGMLNRLGIGIHKTAEGSIDAAHGMKDLANSIAGIKNAQVQGLVARTFGMEALLPLLRKGAVGIEEYQRKVDELGGVRSQAAIDAAAGFGLRLNYLSIAVNGVKESIGEKLIPILQPLIDRFIAWTAANRELIATKVASFVEGLAYWVNQLDFNKIGDDIREFGAKVERVVDVLGGWKNAALAVVLVLNGSLIASVINLGLALGKLAIVTVPAAIRVVGLFAAALDATLVPAILKVLLSAGLYTAGLAEMAAGIPIVGALLSGLSTAFLAVGAAIAATPIGWLIAGVAAVAFGVYAIYKNWDNIVEFFRKKWEGVKSAFDKSWTDGIVKALWEFSPVKLLGDTMNGLTKWLFDFDLYAAGKNIVASLVRGIKSITSMLPSSVLKKLGLADWVSSPGTVNVVSPATAPAAGPAAPLVISQPGAAPAAPGTGRAPIGVRQNNPGNIRSWAGVPSVNGFASFATPQDGIVAMVKNLQAYQNKHGINTLEGVIKRWAPPNENNTSAYIADMAKQTGRSPNEALNLNDPKVVAPMISGIAKHEGNGAGFSQDMINAVVAAQLGGQQQSQQPQLAQKMEITVHAAPGAKVSAKGKGGEVVPVRVNYTMPTLAAS